MIDSWLACKTFDEISEQMNISKGKISKLFNNFRDENYEQIAQNSPDSLKMFNLWNFGKSNDKLGKWKYPVLFLQGDCLSRLARKQIAILSKAFDDL